MFGVVQFAKMAGRSLGKVFKGEDATDKLKKEMDDLGLEYENVDITVGEDGNVKVSGSVPTQEMKEKIILTVGNVNGVGQVEDDIKTQKEEAPSQFYTVKSGDTLWAISKQFYGNGARYPEIFEANRPMLKHPDKIYVGQVLRIPQDGEAAASA